MTISALDTIKKSELENRVAAPSRPNMLDKSKPTTTAQNSAAPARFSTFTGDKFFRGFGATNVFTLDYWTLRARSVQLFHENQYARGLIRRLVTAEINTGLLLEAMPDGDLLGMDRVAVTTWAEKTESLFNIWATNPKLCDYYHQKTYAQLQKSKRETALVSGDVLTIMRREPVTGLPQIQLVPGERVQNPFGVKLRAGSRIVQGVELDAIGRHIAYWVRGAAAGPGRPLTHKRIPAWGEKSGRRLAWLSYGTERRLDDVRGVPILSLFLQSLKDIDRIRDAVLRKAMVNSYLAMFVTKEHPTMGTNPMGGGANLRTDTTVTEVNADGQTQDRTFKVGEFDPGLIIDELAVGEKIEAHTTAATDINYGPFETAIISSFAWANEVSPGILMLAFDRSYSASQAEQTEFNNYLNKARAGEADDFLNPIYKDVLISLTLRGDVDAPGLLEAWRDPRQFVTLGAWLGAAWTGMIKPSVNLLKDVMAHVLMVENGFETRDYASKQVSGKPFDKNYKRLKTENEQLADANESLADDTTGANAPGAVPQDDEDGTGTGRTDGGNGAAPASSLPGMMKLLDRLNALDSKEVEGVLNNGHND